LALLSFFEIKNRGAHFRPPLEKYKSLK